MSAVKNFWTELPKPIFALAPLADVTDAAFRRIIAKYSKGAGRVSYVTYTEFTSADGLARAARGMLAQKNSAVIESLSNITVPSIVIVGANDTPFLAASDYMAAKIPGAKKVVIANAGHASNIDQPKAFDDAVVSFINDLVA